MKTQRYRVEWRHDHPMWGLVDATNEREAIRKARDGEFVADSVDSDPGKDIWTNAKAEEHKQ